MSLFNLQEVTEELVMSGNGKILNRAPTGLYDGPVNKSPNVFKNVLTSTMVKAEDESRR